MREVREWYEGTRLYENIRSGIRGYQIRSTRVSDPGYEGIRSGVRGYMRISDPGYEVF